MATRICGTGSGIPEQVVTNDDISLLVDTNDQWIQERTGIRSRHIIKEETTVSMAVDAGRKALKNAGISAEEVDLILVSTISSNVVLPCAACEVQKELGAEHATCFDLNAACTGFVLAYNTAAAYLELGIYRTALIIGSESLSNLTNWEDRGTCILFGDGAGAVVLRQSEGQKWFPVTHSSGKEGGALICKNRRESGYGRTKDVLSAQEESEIPDSNVTSQEYLMQMDGQAVFKFAVKRVPEVIQELLLRNQMQKEQIRYYILHQANRRIVESVAKRMGEPIEKFPMNLQDYGNTSSASIPILLDELHRKGKLSRQDKIVLAGFGAGLTWGAAVTQWECD